MLVPQAKAGNIVLWLQLEVPVHIFYATADEKSETDTYRKPGTGMWELLLNDHMGGVTPGGPS